MLFLTELYLLRERAEKWSRESYDSVEKKRKELKYAETRLAECQEALEGFTYVDGVDPPGLRGEWTEATIGLRHYGSKAERLRREIQQLEDDRVLAEEEWKVLNSRIAETTGYTGDVRQTIDGFYKGLARQLLEVAKGLDRKLVESYLEAIEYTEKTGQFMEKLNEVIANGEVDRLQVSDFTFFIDVIVEDYRRQISENRGLLMETDDPRKRKGYRRGLRHAQKRLDKWESIESMHDFLDLVAEEEQDFMVRQFHRDSNVAVALRRQDLSKEDIMDIQSTFPSYSFYLGIEEMREKYAKDLADR